MASATYLGVVERGQNGFGVYFPDVPGCVSAGSSLFSAMVNGEQALAAHLELLAQEGEEIPGGSVTADEDIAVVSCFLVDIELH